MNCPTCSKDFAPEESICPWCSATRAPRASAEAWPRGLVLDERFEVTDLLGRGAHADVYRGEDRLLGRAVAIKAVRRDRLAHDPGGRVREQLLREARLVARLEHPSVIQIYDAGVQDGVPWIAMQLVTGGSLAEHLEREGALAPALAASILAQAAAGLDHAHSVGIVHRDLKPANVLIAGRDPRGDLLVKLGDFGIARVLGEPRESGEASEDQVIGTPAYMSPEQIGGGEVGARSDLFSLATVAYEALTGKRAFSALNFHELFLHISHARFELPSRLRPELPVAIDAVFRHALSPAPEERYASAAEFARALRRALPGADVVELANQGLGGYEVLEEAGGSLLARVVKARRRADGRIVSLKIATEVRGRESLKHEIRVLAQLDHPAIPKTVDSGETAEATFLAREWLEGGHRLLTVLAQRRLDLGEVLDIGRQVADILAAVHARGIVHLDLRPNSLLVGPDGKILLGAFDRALERGASAQGDLLTLGTPAYLSPEQIRQERALTEAADLYALGVLLYELAAGRVPFADPSPYLTAMRHLNDPAPPLEQAAPTAPPELSALVSRLLAKQPAARPGSAAEVRDALAAIARNSPGPGLGGRSDKVSWLEWCEVAVVYVDMVGFVELARSSSEARVAFLLERWYELVARAAEVHGGEVSGWMGDSAMVFFRQEAGRVLAARRALGMLCTLGRDLAAINRSLDWGLRFAGGVHQDRILAGQILTRRDGGPTLVGTAAIEADRLCQAAPPGAVLVSENVRVAATPEFRFEAAAGIAIDGRPGYRLLLD